MSVPLPFAPHVHLYLTRALELFTRFGRLRQSAIGGYRLGTSIANSLLFRPPIRNPLAKTSQPRRRAAPRGGMAEPKRPNHLSVAIGRTPRREIHPLLLPPPLVVGRNRRSDLTHRHYTSWNSTSIIRHAMKLGHLLRCARTIGFVSIQNWYVVRDRVLLEVVDAVEGGQVGGRANSAMMGADEGRRKKLSMMGFVLFFEHRPPQAPERNPPSRRPPYLSSRSTEPNTTTLPRTRPHI